MPDNLWSFINDLPKEELIDLLTEYDNYIQRANDENTFDTGWRPVCLAEFYDNEYKMSVEEREREAEEIAEEAARYDGP